MNRKRILLYGDSNTWGYKAETDSRYDDDQRWTMRLSELLGNDYQVVEEGLCGRTTVFDDPLFNGLNGLKYLPISLDSHKPLDTLVIMLGTNDCKERFSATAANIATGVEQLVLTAQRSDAFRDKKRILIVAPIIIGEQVYTLPQGERFGAGCVEKSKKLPVFLKQSAAALGCEFLDSNEFVKPSTADYIHFDLKSQELLSDAIFKMISKK